MGVTNHVIERIKAGLKKYHPILADAKARDINESDTVLIVAGMLADILGYKKFVEITTELAIRGTSVDLAVKVDNDVRFLLEAKSIGTELKDIHVKQAIDYGANQGIEWVVLTNGIVWRLYKIKFQKPIEKQLVSDLDLLATSSKDEETLKCLGNLSREGFTKSSMTEFFQQNQVISKFTIAAVLVSDAVVLATRRELRRLFPLARVEPDVVRTVIQKEVLKREVVDGDEAGLAQGDVKRAAARAARTKAKAAADGETNPTPPTAPVLKGTADTIVEKAAT
jgi:ASC-1-like (ASCH) protein